MTDDQLGRVISKHAMLYTNLFDGEQYERLGAAARALLSPPVATREAVEKWIADKCPGGSLAVKIHAALSHFAPPTSNAPILRMSVEDIAKEMTAAIRDRMDFAERGNIDIGALARVAHRLAQPVPEVDVDAGAKEALWRFWCAVPGRNPYASKEAAWREADAILRLHQGWKIHEER